MLVKNPKPRIIQLLDRDMELAAILTQTITLSLEETHTTLCQLLEKAGEELRTLPLYRMTPENMEIYLVLTKIWSQLDRTVYPKQFLGFQPDTGNPAILIHLDEKLAYLMNKNLGLLLERGKPSDKDTPPALTELADFLRSLTGSTYLRQAGTIANLLLEIANDPTASASSLLEAHLSSFTTSERTYREALELERWPDDAIRNLKNMASSCHRRIHINEDTMNDAILTWLRGVNLAKLKDLGISPEEYLNVKATIVPLPRRTLSIRPRVSFTGDLPSVVWELFAGDHTAALCEVSITMISAILNNSPQHEKAFREISIAALYDQTCHLLFSYSYS